MLNNQVSKAVRLAIAFGAASTAVFSASSIAAEEGVEKVERIAVTGSRIKRTDLEGSVPVTVIDRAAIDFSGQTSVSDLLRNTSFNSAGSFRPQSGSSAQGVSQINLRGLGASRSLILVDGRRLPKSPSTGNSQDLNSIPMAAVERIEILSDGASAVYGSDAIAGVVNIITRKDFNGIEMRIGASEVSLPKDGGDREEGSVVFGASSDKSSVIGGVSWNSRDIIYENAYEWVQPGASSFGANWVRPSGYDGIGADGEPSAGGLSSILSASACDGIDNFFSLGDDFCAYNFNATNANEASTSNTSAFLKANYDINDDWRILSHTLVSKTKSFGRYAPTLNDAGVGAFMSADSPNNPTNPASPFYDAPSDGLGAREVGYRHRFAALGNRDSQVDNWSTDFMISVEGQIGNVFVDFGARKNQTKTYEIGRGYLMGSNARTAVDNGDYMLNDPFGTRFTTDEERNNYAKVLNGLNVTTSRIGTFQQEEVFGSAAFDVMEMNGGTLQAVVGLEYRKEDYSDTYDSLSEAGQVGGSAGNSAGGGRNLTSAYFEALFPVMEGLEFTLAGRYDDYSDYGSDFSPKVSVKYDVNDELVLRASYGEGFRAPTLDILTAKPAPDNPSVSDDPSCLNLGLAAGCDVQVSAITLANAEMGSESSEQISLGLAYQPTDWLNFSADYYEIEISNMIRFFGSDTILTREQTGDPIPAGLGVTRLSNGGIDLITQGYANEGKWEVSGLDVNLNTTFDFDAAGTLKQTLQFSHQFESKIDGGRNTLKDTGEPQQRASLSNSYAIQDFDFTWNINMIGSQYEDVRQVAGGNVERTGNIATWITHDLQATYSFPTGTKVSVGMQNAFEKEPQLSSFGGRSYNFDLYDAYGRVTYLRFSQSF
ncbi:TonB-dependent receptor [Pseudoalteromonas sp. SG44-5]|uniref:TonB-dependent receptor plug domain-containing protein n=1 Tax=unclassified Pseudoalteromonas TaxID=194690 RepID=UPI0015FD249B|nr:MULTISPECIES: TonB-dependent receptor [unclassified Pseudoalteromonas]MBB1406467.1 TonB-dependent receptor [Pseudoalteromonas sp. SG44-5]MBH0093230.1 TonB-dependent receptor [Pseudoalteromonas sp. SCQQ13]